LDTIHLPLVLYTFSSKCKPTKIQPGIVETLSWALCISSCLRD